MGNEEAENASFAGTAPAAAPEAAAAAAPVQNTPVWMETSSRVEPLGRRGATAPRGSGLQTFLFFGAITAAVGAAGILGVTLWGPEKPIKSRSHLATDPPPAMTLPSFPPEPSVPPVATEPAEVAPPAAAESAAPAADPGAPGKKTKRLPRAGKKSH